MSTTNDLKNNKYLMDVIKTNAINNFIGYYGKIDKRLLKCRKNTLKVVFNGDFIYIESSYKRGIKCGQAYNIKNLFYDEVEKGNTKFIEFDMCHRLPYNVSYDMVRKYLFDNYTIDNRVNYNSLIETIVNNLTID